MFPQFAISVMIPVVDQMKTTRAMAKDRSQFTKNRKDFSDRKTIPFDTVARFLGKRKL